MNYKILKDIIRINTIKDKGNEEIVNYIEKYLKSLGFKVEYKTKALIMSIGENPKVGFLGHTDTVEYTENWNTNPLELIEDEENLIGLGVCDMKGGIAAMLDTISEIDFSKCKNGMKFYISYDEEINFEGIKEIISAEKHFPENMIIGEPTNNEMITGSKGLLEYKIIFKGIKTHSSAPSKGKNAILEAIKFINELNIFYNNEIKTNENNLFEIPYTTMNIGTINGGIGINSVPDNCEIKLDFRTTTVELTEKIIKYIEKSLKNYDTSFEILNNIKPFLNNIDGIDKINTCNFITEASFINSKNIILGLGPVTAHEVNEYVSKKSYKKLKGQYKKLIEKFCK